MFTRCFLYILSQFTSLKIQVQVTDLFWIRNRIIRTFVKKRGPLLIKAAVRFLSLFREGEFVFARSNSGRKSWDGEGGGERENLFSSGWKFAWGTWRGGISKQDSWPVVPSIYRCRRWRVKTNFIIAITSFTVARPSSYGVPYGGTMNFRGALTAAFSASPSTFTLHVRLYRTFQPGTRFWPFASTRSPSFLPISNSTSEFPRTKRLAKAR